MDTKIRLQKLTISAALTIAEALEVMDRAGYGFLLVCDGESRLEGILTDGDIRAAALRGEPFSQQCRAIACNSLVTALAPVNASQALHLMDHSRDHPINQLPVVDEAGRVVDLVLRSDLVEQERMPVSAVIMAGGAGVRLRPLTNSLPKVMLPVGDRPLLEIIVEQMRAAGIHDICVTTHYRGEKISDYFGSGQNFGVQIRYVNEDVPMGTAGGLSLLPAQSEPLLVINGDILTRVDYRAMLAYHRRHVAAMTVGVRTYNLKVPYGVLDCDGQDVCGLREKPVVSFFVNAGVYLLNPEVHRMIPAGVRFDMTDLINALLQQSRRVVSFPIVEYWQDIGQMCDYEQVQRDVLDGRVKP